MNYIEAFGLKMTRETRELGSLIDGVKLTDKEG
jgi:hypothetical protein